MRRFPLYLVFSFLAFKPLNASRTQFLDWNPSRDEKIFKGNWTNAYVIDPWLTITHTPTSVESTGVFNSSGPREKFREVILKEHKIYYLELTVNMSQEQFERILWGSVFKRSE